MKASALAASLVISLSSTAAVAADLTQESPILGKAHFQKLTPQQDSAVVGKGYYANLYGYYGMYYASLAQQYGSQGFYYANASYYYSAYTYASYASTYFYDAYTYQTSGS